MVPGDKLKESKRGKKGKPKKVVELVAAEGGGAPSHWGPSRDHAGHSSVLSYPGNEAGSSTVSHPIGGGSPLGVRTTG